MNILVSIVVPCYNQAQYLDECLFSVLNQTYSNWECIIINDGSPDDTKLVADKWLEKDKRFSYIFQENKGVSSARNNAIAQSKGEFILPIDADDIIALEYLEKLVPELENDTSLAIVSCHSIFFKNNLDNLVNKFKPKGETWIDLLYVNKLIVSSLFRKKCWIEVGGFDEDMEKGFEDWEFWLNITKRGWKYKIIEDFLFFYRKAEKSRQVDVLQNHFDTTREYIFKKHQECYIKDFENCISVLFYELRTVRKDEKKIKKSIEYKIIKFLSTPYQKFKKVWERTKK